MDATTTALAAYKQHLRRKFASDVAGLKALADQLIVEVTDNVTITSQSFEGGSHSGQITMPPGLKLAAVEELIVELDSEGTTPRPSQQSVVYFR